MQVNGVHLQETLLKKVCVDQSWCSHQVAKTTAVFLKKCKGVGWVTLLSGCSCRPSLVTVAVMSFSARLMTDSEEWWHRRSKAAM